MAPSIITSCKDCVFAIYEGDTQTDCDLGRLEGFEANGGEVVGIEEEGIQYLQIHNRFCNAARNWDWADQNGLSDPDEILARVEDEYTVKVSMIIYVDSSTIKEEVERSLDSALSQSLLPKEVVIVINDDNNDGFEYVEMMKNEVGIPWQIYRLNPADDVITAVYNNDLMARAIDRAVENTKCTYFTFGQAGYEWHKQFIERLDYAINNAMMRVVVLLPDSDNNGLVFMTNLHKIVKGSRGNALLNKLDDIINYEGGLTAHVVKRWEELPCT